MLALIKRSWIVSMIIALALSTPTHAQVAAYNIRAIDFRNLDYPADCGILEDGSIIAFSLAKPVFGYVTGGPEEDAVVVEDCQPGEGIISKIFVYKIVDAKLQLTKIPSSVWEEHLNDDWGVSGVRINNKQLLVTYAAGGSHAQQAWDLTSTLQWNGSKFIRIKTVRVPHK